MLKTPFSRGKYQSSKCLGTRTPVAVAEVVLMSNVRRCRNGIKIINFSEKICSSVHMEPLSLVAKKWGGLRFREAVAGVTIAQLLTMMISLQHRCGCSTHKTMPRPGWSLPTNSWKGLIMASNPVEYSLRHLQFWVETKLFHVSASNKKKNQTPLNHHTNRATWSRQDEEIIIIIMIMMTIHQVMM